MAIGKITGLFPSGKLNTSNAFSLEDDISLIKIIGMRNGDKALVEVEVGQNECDKKFVPYSPSCCGQLEFCFPQNEFILRTPNVYRLVLTNRFGYDSDPSWFENVEIYQTPVDGANLNLSEGNCGMGCCSQEVKCSPDGILIDGVLCNPPDTFVTSVSESAGGWNLIRNDGVIIPVPLSSPDGSIIVTGGKITVAPVVPGIDIHTTSIVEADDGWELIDNVGTHLAVPLSSPDNTITVVGGKITVNPETTAQAICADMDARNTLIACIGGGPQPLPTCAQISAFPVSASKIGG